MKAKFIVKEEVTVNNLPSWFSKPCRLFVSWVSENEYELEVLYLNQYFKTNSKKVEAINYMLENNNELSNKIAVRMVEEVEMMNTSTFSVLLNS